MLSTKCRQGKVGLLAYPADNRTTMMKIPCKSVFLLLHRIIRFFFSCINALWARTMANTRCQRRHLIFMVPYRDSFVHL